MRASEPPQLAADDLVYGANPALPEDSQSVRESCRAVWEFWGKLQQVRKAVRLAKKVYDKGATLVRQSLVVFVVARFEGFVKEILTEAWNTLRASAPLSAAAAARLDAARAAQVQHGLSNASSDLVPGVRSAATDASAATAFLDFVGEWGGREAEWRERLLDDFCNRHADETPPTLAGISKAFNKIFGGGLAPERPSFRDVLDAVPFQVSLQVGKNQFADLKPNGYSNIAAVLNLFYGARCVYGHGSADTTVSSGALSLCPDPMPVFEGDVATDADPSASATDTDTDADADADSVATDSPSRSSAFGDLAGLPNVARNWTIFLRKLCRDGHQTQISTFALNNLISFLRYLAVHLARCMAKCLAARFALPSFWSCAPFDDSVNYGSDFDDNVDIFA